jgi:hypothetical protein
MLNLLANNGVQYASAVYFLPEFGRGKQVCLCSRGRPVVLLIISAPCLFSEVCVTSTTYSTVE